MKLTVKQNGAIILEKELDTSQEYTIGRSRQCQIILNHPEISRRHVLLKYHQGYWECVLLSQNGHLLANGNPVQRLSLTNGSLFSIAEFDFIFFEEKYGTASVSTGKEKTFLLENSDSGKSKTLKLDKTKTSEISIKYILLRLDDNDEPYQEITLGPGVIEGGREDGCQIPLYDPRASRKHFSIQLNDSGFLIKDLGSRHGITVNNIKIATHRLTSGDKITIGHDKFLYQEIHPSFENLPVIMTPSPNSALGWDPSSAPLPEVRKPKTNLRPLLFVVAVTLVVLAITREPAAPPKAPETKVYAGPLEHLSPEQRKYIEDTYNLSLNLYTSGQYQLAAIEVAKIFKYIPNYKEAKNIEILSYQAMEIKKQKSEAERIRRQQQELQQKIEALLVDCEMLHSSQKFAKIEDCVAKITEIDPENQRAKWLAENARTHLDALENRRQVQIENRNRKLLAKKLMERAKSSFNSKRYPAAISDLSSVTKMDFLDDQGIKQKASEALKVTKEKMRQESLAAYKKGTLALESREFKNAINHFSAAIELDPSFDEAKNLRVRAASDLRVEMKNIYSESVIEENLGNIESAKKKWRIILESDIKNDSYYEKARAKLGKYEK